MKYKNPEMEIVVFGQDVFTDLTTSLETTDIKGGSDNNLSDWTK